MDLIIENIGKKYRREWIFKNFNYQFSQNTVYGIKGYNGSGKSTLLKILSGQLIPSNGLITIHNLGNKIEKDSHYRLYNFIAPYIDLIEELTIEEIIDFSKKTNLIPNHTNLNEFLTFANLKQTEGKIIKDYSSGMKQKLKLALGFISQRPILLIDEPTTNLDSMAKKWFYDKLKIQKNKIILIASNESEDLNYCHELIQIEDYKN